MKYALHDMQNFSSWLKHGLAISNELAKVCALTILRLKQPLVYILEKSVPRVDNQYGIVQLRKTQLLPLVHTDVDSQVLKRNYSDNV